MKIYIPQDLKFWMNDAKKQIVEIQKSNIKQSEKEKLAWRHIEIQKLLSSKEPPEICYEHTEVVTKGPLLDSTWWQDSGFNSKLDSITCGVNTFPRYAGCVPIAMGQIMRYNQHPTNYNWPLMHPYIPNDATATLIKDIHTAFNTLDPIQSVADCSGTSAPGEDIDNVFKTTFNYSQATYADYNYNVVLDNLRSLKPVILGGKDGNIGHMWVCDGYRETSYYNDDCTGITYLQFNMKWGENPNYYPYDGWYAFNDFNSLNGNYSSNKKMVYNIIP